MSIYISSASGNWVVPATWGGADPSTFISSVDTIRIAHAHTVTISQSVTIPTTTVEGTLILI